jgi:hypothetical protein
MFDCLSFQVHLAEPKERCEMLTEYIEAAMRYARCEVFDEDGTHYCEIPVCPEV